MSDHQTLLVEQEGPVARLTLSPPEGLNTITGTLVRGLAHCLRGKLPDVETRAGRG